MHWTDECVSVHPFSSELERLDKVPIVTVALAYDCPVTMTTYVLFFPQALYIKELDHHLLSTAQLRHNQIVVNETPLLHLPNQGTKET